MTESINRRDFLKLVGITGVAGTVGCGAPPGSHLISLANPPQQDIPGIDLWYATTCRECSAGCGVMARTREGRVVKLEGNPGHPVNRGGLCIRGQAALQGLYDPDRIRQPLRRNADGTFSPATWEKAIAEIAERLRQVVNAHKKVVFLSSQNGPALNRLIKEWLRALGSDRHVTFEPFLRTDIQEANRMMFGK